MARITKVNVEDVDYEIAHEGVLKNSGFEVVNSLPTTNLFEGRIITYNNSIYFYTNGNWKEVSKGPDENEEELYSYGIEKDLRISLSSCTRVGNPNLHRTLPVQSQMRGCLLDDEGNIVEYLPQNDWTNATRDGSRGQVMVHIPAHYRKFYTKEEGNVIGVRISLKNIEGYHHVPDMFIGAYEAALDRTNLKLSSVVNTATDFRGGTNISDWDNTYRSLLGRPATNITIKSLQQYARNRGKISWNICTYELRKTLVWLYVIEYANFNSQLEYNAKLTAEGYHQGGLDFGVNNLRNWNSYNNKNPIIPCGYTDSLGNNSGIVEYTAYNKDETICTTEKVSRYRGIENIHGHISEFLEGINILSSASVENGGTGLNKVYVCDNPNNFSFISVDNYTYIGDVVRNNGYIKTLIFGDNGCILPATNGGTSSYPIGDYALSNFPDSGEELRPVVVCNFGNYKDYYSGLFLYSSRYNKDVYSSYMGSRLCFIPQQK